MGLAPLLLAAAIATADGGPQAVAPTPAAESVRVEVVGRLTTGLAAIGGETTGIVVRAKGLAWELDVSLRQDLRQKADGLSGQVVIARGTLEPRVGIERREKRLIVRVTSLEKAPE